MTIDDSLEALRAKYGLTSIVIARDDGKVVGRAGVRPGGTPRVWRSQPRADLVLGIIDESTRDTFEMVQLRLDIEREVEKLLAANRITGT